MATEEQVNELQSKLRGPLVTPSDDHYDAARAVYNAMIDKRPAFIAQCVDVADVIAAVEFGRESGMDVAIRGGGHNGPGLGTVEDGLVIDLGRMKGVHVDPANRTVRVQGGCVWGDVDHATHPFGMAAPGGFVSSTGVGGLTLGGGVGYLSRSVGMTVDSLLSADVVLADGRFVTASESENPDLLWALRGGGGNFGVVTSFEFRLHPVGMIYGGPMVWPMERAAELMAAWRDHILQAPEEHSGWFGFLTVPPGPPFPEEYHLHKMCAILWCDTGPMDEAEQRFTKIRREFGAPAIDFAGPMPWPALVSMFDPLFPPGLQFYWKSDFLEEISDELIAVEVEHGSQMPTMLSGAHIYPINGAVSRVDNADTAFAYRDANFIQMITAVDPDPANNERMIAWARAYWQAVHEHAIGGGYVNMSMDDEGEDQVKATYRGNYDRLVEVKNQYDPTNLFHVNQNIKPTV
jgi:FAD/FMN-containing dehydrogenase